MKRGSAREAREVFFLLVEVRERRKFISTNNNIV